MMAAAVRSPDTHKAFPMIPFNTGVWRNVLPLSGGATSHTMGRKGNSPPMSDVTAHPRNTWPSKEVAHRYSSTAS